ncbi:50S ribosomal protein L11 methyltransferase [Aerococcaceae bacterium DSM 111020]|nr:50S ribosomal protein L11 methyltransferase [Aerococcaceae bacterium DSM 111020]
MSEWHKLIISFASIEPELIDYVNFQLFEEGALGTEIKYAQDYLENNPNLFGEIPMELPQEYLEHAVEVWGYFETANEQIKDRIEAGLSHFEDDTFNIHWETIANENWQQNWMQYYQQERISRHLVIVPAWEDYQPNDEEMVIYLDPGVAFGTGNHPTTQLGGQSLSIYMHGNERVLDIGTGSGVLSFIAAALGAKSVAGYDLDPQAVESAKMNLTLQKLSSIQELIDQKAIHFAVNDLMKGLTGPFDIIIANILPHILVNMLEDAHRELTQDGYLILGGILEDKGSEIEKALTKHKFKVVQKNQLGEWLGYVAQKEEVSHAELFS